MKRQTQEDGNGAEVSPAPSLPQLERLQEETPVESPATTNQDSDSVVTGTEAPSESASSAEQTPDITPSPTPDLQGANVGAKEDRTSGDMVPKAVAPHAAVVSEEPVKETCQSTDVKVASLDQAEVEEKPEKEEIPLVNEPEKAMDVTEAPDAKVTEPEKIVDAPVAAQIESPMVSEEAPSEPATSI